MRINPRRFEVSPFQECYDSADLTWSVYAGRLFPLSSEDDPKEKYWALRRRAAMYDVPERPVEIRGPDVVPSLDYVLARNIASLKRGRGRYVIACNHEGGVFMDGVLFNVGENRYWYVQPDGALETWLAAHSLGFDITVSDPQSRVIQLQGPASLRVMHAASAGQIDEGLGYFHAGFFELGGQRVYVSRTGYTGERGYEIYTFGSETDHPSLWEHLMRCGEPFGMEFSCLNSMEPRRIEAGILDNGTDMDGSLTPFQVGLGAYIDLDKEKFIGREALLRSDRRSLLYGVKCTQVTPRMHWDVLDGDRVVGTVTAGAYSPYLECHVGYVRFFEPAAWEGRSLHIRDAHADFHACEIVLLPFYDHEKRIAKGLDLSIP